jgi:glycosyltransferase involved in cell wall biosynthesis
MPYLGASIGGTAKIVSKKTKKIAIIDSMRAAGKIVFEEQANQLFTNNYDAFIVLNNPSKDDLLQLKPDAIYREHARPIFTHSVDKIEQKIARKILNLPLNKNILLYLGEVRHHRGIDTAIQTLSQLDDNYHLFVAGQSPSGLDYYRKKIRDLNIESKITFMEHNLNYSEIPYIFYASDVLIMPYQKEISRQEINQIFGYELPVIATDVGNFKEDIKDFGIIIENQDADLLGDAITKYFNENLKEQFIKNLNSLKYDSS